MAKNNYISAMLPSQHQVQYPNGHVATTQSRPSSVEAPLDTKRVISMRAKDLQVQTLVNLGSLWQEIADVKS